MIIKYHQNCHPFLTLIDCTILVHMYPSLAIINFLPSKTVPTQSCRHSTPSPRQHTAPGRLKQRPPARHDIAEHKRMSCKVLIHRDSNCNHLWPEISRKQMETVDISWSSGLTVAHLYCIQAMHLLAGFLLFTQCKNVPAWFWNFGRHASDAFRYSFNDGWPQIPWLPLSATQDHLTLTWRYIAF